VQKLHREPAHEDFFAVGDWLKVAGAAVHEVSGESKSRGNLSGVIDLIGMHIYPGVGGFEEFLQAIDVIGVAMSNQDPADSQIGFLSQPEDCGYIPGRIDDRRFTSFGAADQVNEIHHRPEFGLL
jgi:hypothetical protein